jgi:hypothetical protein
MKQKEISKKELEERIKLNYDRLEKDPYYQIGDVFSPDDYDWYGDKEGRALLAFVSHYKISKKKIPCMDELISLLPHHLNEKGYMGKIFHNEIHEQQLSGHSWLLRGLCEYYLQFRNENVITTINNIFNNLFLPILEKVKSYPVIRSQENQGDVSGNSALAIDGWILSTDVGCAFMSIDGLSQVYDITKDENAKALTDEMIKVYMGIDKQKLKVQTHCTLTAARGMLRMFSCTKEEKYVEYAKEIYELYVNGGGMTYTYHNLNWWGRPDTWSEPCAIVDSLMLSTELFKITGEPKYRTTAARIYHNAFSSLQRSNGGAGTDTLVCENSPWDYLQTLMYEAYFCCTMRLAEGLWYISENHPLLYAEYNGTVSKNNNGVYTDGDIIYCCVEDEFLKYAEEPIKSDGITLVPIIKMYRVPFDDDTKIRMKILV